MPVWQRLRTRLWPIIGLDLEPEFPEGELALGQDIPLQLALLSAQSPGGTIMLRATSAGALITTSTPPVHTHYEQVRGDLPADFNEANTYVWTTPRSHFTYRSPQQASVIQLQLQPGVWGGDIYLAAGTVIDYAIQIYGFRCQGDEVESGDYWLITLW